MLSVGARATGIAKSNASGAGPMAGMLSRKPTPGGDAVVVGVEFDLLFRRAVVAEYDPFDHVVGSDREEVLDGAEEAELTTDRDTTGSQGRCTAEIEATHRGVTAGKVVLVDRRLRAGEPEPETIGQRMPSGTVRSLAHQEVLSVIEFAARIVERPERLLVSNFEIMPLRGQGRHCRACRASR